MKTPILAIFILAPLAHVLARGPYPEFPAIICRDSPECSSCGIHTNDLHSLTRLIPENRTYFAQDTVACARCKTGLGFICASLEWAPGPINAWEIAAGVMSMIGRCRLCAGLGYPGSDVIFQLVTVGWREFGCRKVTNDTTSPLPEGEGICANT